jgi:predicted dithiol-disulfide oxidoreductase (DUF899 family)
MRRLRVLIREVMADHFDGVIVHLNQRDVTLLLVSRAPLEKLE